MRAIDADRLQKQFDKKSTNPNYRVNMHNIKSIISNATTVEAIPKDQYEARLKADMVAMLTDIQLEIEELDTPNNNGAYMDCVEIIQQKIDALREVVEDSEQGDTE